jgi:hypothetical protein
LRNQDIAQNYSEKLAICNRVLFMMLFKEVKETDKVMRNLIFIGFD